MYVGIWRVVKGLLWVVMALLYFFENLLLVPTLSPKTLEPANPNTLKRDVLSALGGRGVDSRWTLNPKP